MTSKESLVRTLGEQNFFRGMEDEHLANLASLATEIEVAEGEDIFEEGGSADSAYVIIDGSVALELSVSHRGHHIVQTLHAGELLGWGWLFPPYRWSFGALALDPTRLIRFDAEQLRAMQEADHDFGYDMMRRFAQVMMSRLSATRHQLVDFYGNSH